MRRNRKWTVILLIAAGSSSACAPDQPLPSDAPRIVVVEARGDVRQAGALLADGAHVDLDAPIVVGKGRAIIELPGGETVRLFDDSQLRFASRSRLKLLAGKLWALVDAGRGSKLSVETRNAVAGVRGTEFVVEVSAGKTRIGVMHGRVAVSNLRAPEKQTMVDAGGEVTVEDEAPPTAASPFDPKPVREQWQQLETLKPNVQAAPAPNVVDEKPVDEGRQEPEAPPETGSLKGAPRRPKNALEREGDEKKRQLQREGEATKRRLVKESEETKNQLRREEKKQRDEMKRDREKAGGSVKDFLD